MNTILFNIIDKRFYILREYERTYKATHPDNLVCIIDMKSRFIYYQARKYLIEIKEVGLKDLLRTL